MSDQDFFFDEDEKPAPKAAEKNSKPAAKPSASKGAPAKSSKASSATPSSGIELSWTITALIAVVTLLLGVIVGYSIPKSASVDTGTTGTTTGQEAPQLSPEQMQTGTLPEGHPDIGAMGAGGSTGTTGSAETTGN